MRKIIDGKMYNTETADFIAEAIINGEYYSWQMLEELYRKENGEFFIKREFCGDGDCEWEYEWVLSHRMQPLSTREVKNWVERYCSVEQYIDLFDEPEE